MILAVIGEQTGAIVSLRLALGLLLVVHLIPMSLLAVEVYRDVVKQYRGMKLAGIGLVTFVVGVVVPCILLFILNEGISILIAMFCIFMGSWLSRYIIVMLPHHE